MEKKSFSGIDKVNFEHSFGNITVTESDSKQVELEIRYFDGEKIKPDCKISTSGNVLTVKTVYPKKSIIRNKKNKITIDYIIAVPKNVAMKINLAYGDINMGDFYGDFTCNLDFGNLNANTFFYSQVYIKGDYSGFKIDKATALNFSGDFSNLKINTADWLDVKSGYTKYKIGKVRTIKAKCEFGNIDVDSAGEFDAKLEYTPATVENLGRKLNLGCSFSNVKIKGSSGQLESVKFSGSYSDLSLSLDPDLSADFYVNLEYGNLSIDSKYKYKYSLSVKDYEKDIKEGIIGSKTPTAKIDISGSFGKISIK
jgi:hypothetical protein